MSEENLLSWSRALEFSSLHHRHPRKGYITLGTSSINHSPEFSFSAGACSALEHYFLNSLSPKSNDALYYQHGALVVLKNHGLIGIIEYHSTPYFLALQTISSPAGNHILENGVYVPSFLDTLPGSFHPSSSFWDVLLPERFDALPARYLDLSYANNGVLLDDALACEKERLNNSLILKSFL